MKTAYVAAATLVTGATVVSLAFDWTGTTAAMGNGIGQALTSAGDAITPGIA